MNHQTYLFNGLKWNFIQSKNVTWIFDMSEWHIRKSNVLLFTSSSCSASRSLLRGSNAHFFRSCWFGAVVRLYASVSSVLFGAVVFFVVAVRSLPLAFEKDINWFDCQSYHIFYALAHSPWSFHQQYMEHGFFCFALFCLGFISQYKAHTFGYVCEYVHLYYF